MADVSIMKKSKQAEDSIVKTTIRLPRGVWHAARVRALDEQIDFQDLVVAALEAHLKKPRRKGGAR
jgi:hypothetical protein